MNNKFNGEDYIRIADHIMTEGSIEFKFDDESETATSYEAQLVKEMLTTGLEECVTLMKAKMDEAEADEFEMRIENVVQLRISKSDAGFAIAVTALSGIHGEVTDESEVAAFTTEDFMEIVDKVNESAAVGFEFDEDGDSSAYEGMLMKDILVQGILGAVIIVKEKGNDTNCAFADTLQINVLEDGVVTLSALSELKKVIKDDASLV